MVLRIVRVSFVFNVFIFVCERKLDSVLLSGQDEIEEGEEELHSTDKDNNRGNVASSTPISKSPMRRYILCRTKLHTLNFALLTGLTFCTISSMLHFTFRALWLQPTLTYTHTSSSLATYCHSLIQQNSLAFELCSWNHHLHILVKPELTGGKTEEMIQFL